MRYRTTRHVGYNKKIRDPETPITFKEGDEKIRDRLLELGAIVEDKSVVATPVPPPQPLAEQSLQELKATAKAAGVKGYNLIKDPAKLILAIEKAAAAKAEG